MIKARWEPVTDGSPIKMIETHTHRLRVDGGYLYRTITIHERDHHGNGNVAIAQTFVPDTLQESHA